MSVSYPAQVPDSLAVLFREGSTGAHTDAELLARFIVGRGDQAAEAAFAALVDRHGPMVLGVCRRLAGDFHAADDAFQAVFLVLARRARAVRLAAEDSLGPWLYGVSLRLARRARAEGVRRLRTTRSIDGLEPIDDSLSPDPCEQADLKAALDAEIARLPVRYRAVVMLCYLEGLSRQQAARRLRCPVGTVDCRLHRARLRLRSGLIRSGLTTVAGALAGMLEQSLRAEVPPGLVRRSVDSAASISAGKAVIGAAPAAAGALAGSHFTAMALRRVGMIAALVAMGMTAAVGVGGLAGGAGDPPKAAQVAGKRGPGEPVRARAYDLPLPVVARLAIADLKVIDDATGQPIGGVEVMVFNSVDGRTYTPRTDERGRLRLEYPYIGVRPFLNMELRKEGFVPLRYSRGHEGGPDVPRGELGFRLRRGTTMGGIVVHADDQPIEGAIVVMTVKKYGAGKRTPNPTGEEFYYEVPSRTGRDGRWRTDSVPPGAEEVSLQMIHPDFVCDGSTTLGNPGRSPKLAALVDRLDRQVLLRGLRIDGRVLDDRGHPVAGARIVDSTRGLTFLPYVWRAATDVEGRFHIHLLRGQAVTLTVQAPGYQPAIREIASSRDGATVEIRLAPSRRLWGRVVDSRGEPIAGAQVHIPSYSRYRGVYFRTWTDAEGRFEWDDAPSDRVLFSIGAHGYVPSDPVWLTAGDKPADVVLTPGFLVRLRIIDADDGKNTPRFRVQIGHVANDGREVDWKVPTKQVFSDEYRTWLAADGAPYRIRILAEGYVSAETRTIGRDEQTVNEVVRLAKESK